MGEHKMKKEEIPVHESSADACLIKNEMTNDSNDIFASSSLAKLPQKRFFRQRAHANPFSDHLLE